MKLIIKKTSDGSHTLYDEQVGDHYHSTNGAVMESMHIFIKSGFLAAGNKHIDILEAGYGTGLNALLTLVEATRKNISVHFTSIEKFPLESNIISGLNYCDFIGREFIPLYDRMTDAHWNIDVLISDNFTLKKVKCDLADFKSAGGFDVIYFDAFGPEKQPGMWTREIISGVAGMIRPGGIFVTYSARGELKRILRDCGMKVEHLPGPPGKREFTRAIRPLP